MRKNAAASWNAPKRWKAKAATQDLEQSQRQSAEAARYFGQSLSDGLSDALLDGKSLTNVFADITKSLARAVIQAELLGTGPLAGLLGTSANASAGGNAIGGLLGTLTGRTGGTPSGDGPGFGSLFGFFTGSSSPIPRFADGGYTGPGGAHQPAGVVHGGEYVIPKVAVARIGLPTLEAMRRGVAGYAAGGLVGGGAVAGAPGSAFTNAPRISIDARGSTMSEGQVRGIVVQSLAASNAERDRTMFQRQQMGRRAFG